MEVPSLGMIFYILLNTAVEVIIGVDYQLVNCRLAYP